MKSFFNTIKPQWSAPTTFTPTWDWLSAALLLTGLSLVSGRLVNTSWTPHLKIIQTLTFISGVFGLLLGVSRFKTKTAVRLSAAYGLYFVLWQLGLTLGKHILWTERLSSLLGRMNETLRLIFEKAPVTDPLLFLLIMSVLFWFLAFNTSYQLMHAGDPWRLVVVGGIVVIIVQLNDNTGSNKLWSLALFLAVSVMLLGRTYFLQNLQEWKLRRVHVPSSAGANTFPIILLTAFFLLITTWVLPGIAEGFDPAEESWREFTQPLTDLKENLKNTFDALKSSAAGVSDDYGESLQLGEGNPKSDTITMLIETPLRPLDTIRFYWRARTYDYYDPFSLGWETNAALSSTFDPAEDTFYSPAYHERWASQIEVIVQKPLSVLYTAQETTWVSRPTKISRIDTVQGSAETPTGESVVLQAEQPLRKGESYQFTALINNATVNALNEAGTEYPEWVTANYLQLPSSITERTRALAAFIAEGQETPYQIAEAITDYLRATISYAEVIPEVPAGQDPIDWVLFEHQEAFCNYYATAEVVLLRSLGIPSRLAVGYSQGELNYLFDEEGFDSLQGQIQDEEINERIVGEIYTVRVNNLHAWPEVFFPGIGWVEFEPTTSLTPIRRLELDPSEFTGENNLSDEPQEEQPNGLAVPEEIAQLLDQSQQRQKIRRLYTFVGSILTSMLLFGAATLIARRRKRLGLPPLPVLLEKSLERFNLRPPKLLKRWSRYAQLGQLARAYQEINKTLRVLKLEPGAQATPAERSRLLAGKLPQLAAEIEQLLEQYQLATYSLEEADLEIAVQAALRISKYRRSLNTDLFLDQLIRILRRE